MLSVSYWVGFCTTLQWGYRRSTCYIKCVYSLLKEHIPNIAFSWWPESISMAKARVVLVLPTFIVAWLKSSGGNQSEWYCFKINQYDYLSYTDNMHSHIVIYVYIYIYTYTYRYTYLYIYIYIHMLNCIHICQFPLVEVRRSHSQTKVFHPPKVVPFSSHPGDPFSVLTRAPPRLASQILIEGIGGWVGPPAGYERRFQSFSAFGSRSVSWCCIPTCSCMADFLLKCSYMYTMTSFNMTLQKLRERHPPSKWGSLCHDVQAIMLVTWFKSPVLSTLWRMVLLLGIIRYCRGDCPKVIAIPQDSRSWGLLNDW